MSNTAYTRNKPRTPKWFKAHFLKHFNIGVHYIFHGALHTKVLHNLKLATQSPKKYMRFFGAGLHLYGFCIFKWEFQKSYYFTFPGNQLFICSNKNNEAQTISLHTQKIMCQNHLKTLHVQVLIGTYKKSGLRMPVLMYFNILW